MQPNHWIWKHKEWPEFTFDANRLLSDLGVASQLIGELEVISRSINGQEVQCELVPLGRLTEYACMVSIPQQGKPKMAVC